MVTSDAQGPKREVILPEIIEENEIINPGEFTGDDFVHFILLHID